MDVFSSRKPSHIKIDKKVTQARWSNKLQNDNTGEYHVGVHCLILVEVGSKIFQQVTSIHMGTHCAPLVADLFLLSSEFDFMKAKKPFH